MKDLSEKLHDEPTERVARLDFSSFTEPEQQLIQKIWSLQEKYGSELPAEVSKANEELLWKTETILCKYVLDTFKFVMLYLLGDCESKIDKWYFNLHFYSFFQNLKECLTRVHNWSQTDREKFQALLENDLQSGQVFLFSKMPTAQNRFPKENKTSGL